MRNAQPLYSTATVRAIDAAAIAGGIAGYVLMIRAGEAAFGCLRERWPEARKLLVICGPGNNGGDGYVLARCARAEGLDVSVLSLDADIPRSADAKQALADWRAAGGDVSAFDPRLPLPVADVVVDALFGIGLARAPELRAAALIEAVNRFERPVLALDVPSGVDADSGAIPGAAVRATVTVSFIANKRGLLTGPALDAVGELRLHGLDVPAAAFLDQQPAAYSIDARALADLPVRRANGHKGDHGHVLAVGGDHGAGGALRLCVEAAMRSGAGLVSALTRTKHVAPLLTARPECMTHASRTGELPAIARRATVIALGPGLGQADWGRALFSALIEDPRPLVLDADALNLLAAEPRPVPGRILTPHPGEAARLLDCSVPAVQRDRYAALDQLVERYAATVVLKGAGTLIGAPGEPTIIIRAGNPGMASGGMGDVLTGVIAALIAQGVADYEAAALGAVLHSAAGDQAAMDGGQRGLLASDLLPWLRGDRARQAFCHAAEQQ
ncbi:MAG: NAD(P)H-hydrate dehydratase [Pseudomarimonas sp.]